MGYFICTGCKWIPFYWDDSNADGRPLPHSEYICDYCGRKCELIFEKEAPETDEYGYVITGRQMKRAEDKQRKEAEQEDW